MTQLLDTRMPSMDEAKAGRDSGMGRAATSAGETWNTLAYAAFVDFARASTGTFLTEDVRLASRYLPPPPDNRAWGAVVTRARRAGVVKQVGYAPARTGHCRPMPVWSRA